MAFDLMIVTGLLGTAIVFIFLGSHLKEKEDTEQVANPFLTFAKVLLFAMALFMVYLTFGVMHHIVVTDVSNATLQGNLTSLIDSGMQVTMGGGLFILVLMFGMFVVTLFTIFLPIWNQRNRR